MLKPTHREVLRLRYFEKLDLYETAEKMMYEYKYVSNLHATALKELAKFELEPFNCGIE